MCFVFVFSSKFAAHKSFIFPEIFHKEILSCLRLMPDFYAHLFHLLKSVDVLYIISSTDGSSFLVRYLLILLFAALTALRLLLLQLRARLLLLRSQCFPLIPLLRFCLVLVLSHGRSGDVFFLPKRDALHRLSKCACRNRLFFSVGHYCRSFSSPPIAQGGKI